MCRVKSLAVGHEPDLVLHLLLSSKDSGLYFERVAGDYWLQAINGKDGIVDWAPGNLGRSPDVGTASLSDLESTLCLVCGHGNCIPLQRESSMSVGLRFNGNGNQMST